jgi:hypothetical protein
MIFDRSGGFGAHFGFPSAIELGQSFPTTLAEGLVAGANVVF